MSARAMQHPRFALVTATVAVLATLFLVTNAQADSPLEPCADVQALAQAVQRLNDLRHADAPCVPRAGGRYELHWSTQLAESARQQAADLALRDRLSHVDSQQRGLGARLRQDGYAAESAGENLAASHRHVGDALEAWLGSLSHGTHLGAPVAPDAVNAMRGAAVVAAMR